MRTLHAWMAVEIQYGDIVDASPVSSWWSNYLYEEKEVVASDVTRIVDYMYVQYNGYEIPTQLEKSSECQTRGEVAAYS